MLVNLTAVSPFNMKGSQCIGGWFHYKCMLSIWNCKEMGNCCNNKLLDLRSQNKETEFFSPFVRHTDGKKTLGYLWVLATIGFSLFFVGWLWKAGRSVIKRDSKTGILNYTLAHVYHIYTSCHLKLWVQNTISFKSWKHNCNISLL